MKKRIVIVDDHVAIRDMLAWILRHDGGFEVVGEAGSGIEAIKVCDSSRPDLLILDLVLPCLSGVEVLRRVRAKMPQMRVLIFSGTSNFALMMDALREKPHGYVGKLEGLPVLRSALSALSAGQCYYGPEAAQLLSRNNGARLRPADLSHREREVLQMVAEGRSSKQISGVLNVAVKTVENHRANLMAKLDMHDIASLTRYATSLGLVAVE